MEKLDLLLGIVLGFLGVLAYFKGFFRWLWDRATSSGPKIPRKTLALVVEGTGHECWWHMGKSGGDPAMQIVARFSATNISDFGVLPTSARMRKPRFLGHVMTQKHDENIYGSYIIPTGVITKLAVDFWVTPPVKNEGATFKADIAIIDQFGNQHWVKKVEFQYR